MTVARAPAPGVTRMAGAFARLNGRQAGFLAFVLGGVAATGHAPLHAWPATAVALVGLVWLLDAACALDKNLKAAFWRGWCFGVGYFLAGTWWVASAFVVRGPEFAPFAPFGAAALALGLALFHGGAAALAGAFWRDGPRRIAVFAVAFALFEYLRGFVLSGFPWNVFGHVWPAGGPMSQSAAFFGVWGLTLVTLYAFAAPAALLGPNPSRIPRWAPTAAAFAVLAFVFAAGVGRLSDAADAFAPGVRLRVIQADLTEADKWRGDGRVRVLEHYLALSAREGLETRTHIVWPEGALPFPILESPPALNRLAEVFDDEQMLLMGSARREPDDPARLTVYNSFLALAFRGGSPFPEMIYDKSKLVPFGEFLPLSGVMERMGLATLSRRLPGGFTPGPGPATVPITGAPPAAPQICYETIFPGFTPRGQDRPAWIINVSNDGWYGDTAGPRQHLNQARYRAIEEGVPLVRAATGGVSAVIDPYGRLPEAKQLPFKEDGVLDAPLPAALAPTLYALVGDAVFALLFTGLALTARRPRAGRQSPAWKAH